MEQPAMEAVLDYLDSLSSALRALAEEVFFIGRAGDVGPLVGWSCSGEISRTGTLAGLGKYSFHGIGCLVVTNDEKEIDFDWGEHGEVLFDGWRVRRFVESVGPSGPSQEALVAACNQLVLEGRLTRKDEQFFALP